MQPQCSYSTTSQEQRSFSPFVTIDVPFAKTKPILLLVPFSQTKLVVSLTKPEPILASPFPQPKRILARPFPQPECILARPFAQPEPILPGTLAQPESILLLVAFPEPKAILAIPFAKTEGVTPFSWPERTKHLLRDLPLLLRISSKQLKRARKKSDSVAV